MRKILYISLFFSFAGMTACEKENTVDEQAPSQATLSISAFVEGATPTKAFGDTGYEAAAFASDNIGIFATITQNGGATLPTRANIFFNYSNVGYIINSAGTGTKYPGSPLQPTIYAPMFSSTKLDMYAYYPWPGNNQVSSVTNFDDLNNVKFRIFQDQSKVNVTGANINLCNIMRAVPIRNKSYPTGSSPADIAARNVNFKFQHIMSLLEFHLSKDPDGGWVPGDSLMLDRIVVLGKKVSTEGTFSLVADNPNVQISNNPTTSNSSIYKTDPLTNLKPNANSGATTTYPYTLRSAIIPPVASVGPYDPDVDQQGDVEFVFSLRWTKNGETSPREVLYTNRNYIVEEGTVFESGKKYIFNVLIKKYDPEYTKIKIAATPVAWDNTINWGTTFE